MPKLLQTPVSVLTSLMNEYQLNPFSLSQKIGLSNSSIRQILMGNSGISVPTALKLAKFFGQCPSYWLDLQLQADIKEAENNKELQKILKGISRVAKPSASIKGKSGAKSGKTNTLAEKRKKAAKVPGAKPASRKRSSK